MLNIFLFEDFLGTLLVEKEVAKNVILAEEDYYVANITQYLSKLETSGVVSDGRI